MGVMYLLRGLLNVLQDYTWEPNSDARILVYTRVLAMLATASQENYPYHIDKGKYAIRIYSFLPHMFMGLWGATHFLTHL